jgi:hypothetical protein
LSDFYEEEEEEIRRRKPTTDWRVENPIPTNYFHLADKTARLNQND